MVDTMCVAAGRAGSCILLNRPRVLRIRDLLPRAGGTETFARVAGVLLPRTWLRSPQPERQVAV